LRDQRILRAITWSIRSDEHWAIIGGNGSGKSVLARALYGAVPVVSGEVEHHFLNRREPGTNRPRSAEDFIAHVSFEDHQHFIGQESPYLQSRWNSCERDSGLTTLDALCFLAGDTFSGRRRKSRTGMKELARNAPATRYLDIASLFERKLAHLSNGEMRKVLIAGALLRSPLILILDEPFAGLDYRSRRALRSLLSGLMKGATRVIFVSSHPNELPRGITHVLRLEGGTIAAIGEKEKVLRTYPDKWDIPPPAPEPRGSHRRRTRDLVPVLFKISKACVTYGGIRVLDKVNWTVREEERWAVLGPNGSGKTTLLSLILGDNPQAYANDIRVFGKKRGNGETIWDVKKHIGFLSPELHIHYRKTLTVLEIVCSGYFDSIGLYRECSGRRINAALKWMRALGLSALAEKRFDELSAGQQRMVLLARASVKRPRLLILDEPCHGLDPENKRVVLDAIDAIARRELNSLIYVTHRLEELPACISHVLRLRNGRITAKGKRVPALGKRR